MRRYCVWTNLFFRKSSLCLPSLVFSPRVKSCWQALSYVTVDHFSPHYMLSSIASYCCIHFIIINFISWLFQKIILWYRSILIAKCAWKTCWKEIIEQSTVWMEAAGPQSPDLKLTKNWVLQAIPETLTGKTPGDSHREICLVYYGY